MKKTFFLLTGVLFLVFISCQDVTISNTLPSDYAIGSDVTVLGNARSLIKGETFGGHRELEAKKISVIVQSAPEGLVLKGPVYAIKENDGSFFVILEIENTGFRNYSFVKIDDVFYYDVENKKLNATKDLGFSRGNVGKISTGSTNTCLFPNNSGLVLLYGDSYSDLSYITCTISANLYPPSPVASEMKAETYTAQNSSLEVTFRNTGAYVLDVDISSFYLLRNAEGIPVDWGYTYEIEPKSGIIEINASGVTSAYLSTIPFANQVEICFDYEPFLEGRYMRSLSNAEESVKYKDKWEYERKRNERYQRLIDQGI